MRLKLATLILCVFSFSNLVFGIGGNYISTNGILLFQFDQLSKTLQIKSFSQNELDVYNYSIKGEELLIEKEDAIIVYTIIEQNNDILSLQEKGLPSILHLYQIDLNLNTTDFENYLINNTVTLLNNDIPEKIGVFLNTKEILIIKDRIVTTSKEWNTFSENGMRILKIENVHFVILKKTEQGFQLGSLDNHLRSGFALSELILKKETKLDDSMFGDWCAQLIVKNDESTNVLDYQLSIKSNQKAILHRKDWYHAPSTTKLEIIFSTKTGIIYAIDEYGMEYCCQFVTKEVFSEIQNQWNLKDYISSHRLNYDEKLMEYLYRCD